MDRQLWWRRPFAPGEVIPRGVAALLLAVGLAAAVPAAPAPVSPPVRLARLHAYPVVQDDERPAAATASEEHAARRAVSRDSFHDPANPDRVHLQDYDQAMAGLPKDANGFPDWMRALREGAIKPRGSLTGRDVMDVLDLDIVMKNTKEMPWVRFPHRAHTEWLTCSNCHPRPFEAKAGATRIQMAEIFRGRYCGQCHDRVAFITFFSCARCHSVAQTPAVPGVNAPGGPTRP